MNQPTELQLLKERALTMGITHSPNIGVEALKAKIEAKLANLPDPGEGTDNTDIQAPPAGMNNGVKLHEGEPAVTPTMLTRAQLEQAEREKQWAEQLRLVRIRVICLNPAKKELQGEIFTVGNDFMGTVRKFVPFGEAGDAGWHVPYVIYKEIESRVFNSIRVKKKNSAIGGQHDFRPEGRLVKEYAIELLPDLTEEEMRQLATQQAAAAGMA